MVVVVVVAVYDMVVAVVVVAATFVAAVVVIVAADFIMENYRYKENLTNIPLLLLWKKIDASVKFYSFCFHKKTYFLAGFVSIVVFFSPMLNSCRHLNF